MKRIPPRISQSSALAKIIYAIGVGHEYPTVIAERLGKTLPAIVIQLRSIVPTRLVVFKKDPSYNRTVYWLDWERVAEFFIEGVVGGFRKEFVDEVECEGLFKVKPAKVALMQERLVASFKGKDVFHSFLKSYFDELLGSGIDCSLQDAIEHIKSRALTLYQVYGVDDPEHPLLPFFVVAYFSQARPSFFSYREYG